MDRPTTGFYKVGRVKSILFRREIRNGATGLRRVNLYFAGGPPHATPARWRPRINSPGVVD